MKPEDVPDDLCEAAFQAYLRAPRVPIDDVSVWDYVLAAVLPVHKQQVREQVAAEIEAEPRDPSSEYERGLNVAADIARGGA